MMRNSPVPNNNPGILPISTAAAAAAVAPAAPIEAFYQQQPPMIVAPPQIPEQPISVSGSTSVQSTPISSSVPVVLGKFLCHFHGKIF